MSPLGDDTADADGTQFRPRGVASTLVADQVYEILANDIFTGRLPAGARLPVRDVANQVGTSVMPVREAIRLLVENGLAVSHPHRGARVREFTHRELIQIYDVRSLLEVEATRQGAPEVTPGDLDEMRAACGRLYRAVVELRVSDALDEDEALLRRLYRAGGNAVLLETIESLWIQCRPYKVIGARAAIQNHDASLWAPQPALVDALEAGQTELAIEINRECVAAARRRLEAEITP
ncbi:MAG: GntR family transcriptional regulator [Nocardioides sp.]|nr:GntR family transcriptional regulator [Nocardioides sp.]